MTTTQERATISLALGYRMARDLVPGYPKPGVALMSAWERPRRNVGTFPGKILDLKSNNYLGAPFIFIELEIRRSEF